MILTYTSALRELGHIASSPGACVGGWRNKEGERERGRRGVREGREAREHRPVKELVAAQKVETANTERSEQ